MISKIKLLSGSTIKIIGMELMVIDHIGYYYYSYNPNLFYIFRIIGRLSFPLFAFLIVEGMRYTRSRERYLFQLLILSIIMELGSYLAFGYMKGYSLNDYYLSLKINIGNVISTFFFTASFIYFIEYKKIYIKL